MFFFSVGFKWMFNATEKAISLSSFKNLKQSFALKLLILLMAHCYKNLLSELIDVLFPCFYAVSVDLSWSISCTPKVLFDTMTCCKKTLWGYKQDWQQAAFIYVCECVYTFSLSVAHLLLTLSLENVLMWVVSPRSNYHPILRLQWISRDWALYLLH